MSLLPQRKKSAEEIAHLRESLGVPALPESKEEPPAPDTIVPTHHQAILAHHPEPGPEEPGTRPISPKPVRSLRKSEQVPVLMPVPAEPTANSQLPVYRHSDEEIAFRG